MCPVSHPVEDQKSLLLALAADPEWNLLTKAVNTASANVKALTDLATKALKPWNSMTKTLTNMLTKKSALAEVTLALDELAAQANISVDHAWSEGLEIGKKAGNDLLKQAGLLTQDALVDQGLLAELHKDVERNHSEALLRIKTALQAGDVEVAHKVVSDLTRRLKLSSDAAARRASTEAALAQYQAAGARKMWVARLIPNVTCSYCTALHGTIVEWNEDFPGHPKLKSYHGLPGPPRHPNCGCVVVPVTTTKAKRVKRQGIREMIKRNLKPPLTMSAEEIRDLPEAMRKEALDWMTRQLFG